MEKVSKKCPFCSEEILSTAIKCKYCNEWLEPRETVLMRKDTTLVEALSPKYEIIEKIAQGGEAAVYKARKKNLDAIVALKVFSKNRTVNSVIDSSIMEARRTAQLTHENIIRVYDVGEIQGYSYIEMEFIEGGTLRDIILNRGVFEETEAIDIIKSILKGLKVAHKKNIIHRDIKSSNIMFRDGVPKLMDFGIAKNVEGTMHTEFGQVKGTPQYMSPEQIKNPEKIDERSDLYSIGILMYEILTGKLPFDADSPVSIIHLQVSEKPAKPRDFNENISIGMEKIILKTLQKNPNDRFCSCDELISALESLEDLEKLKVKIPKKIKKKRIQTRPEKITKFQVNPFLKHIFDYNSLIFILISAIIVITLIISIPDLSGLFVKDRIMIKGGTFELGSEFGERDEKPPTRVNVDNYIIWQHEVTFREFNEFIKSGSYITTAERNKEGYKYSGDKWIQDEIHWKKPGFDQSENNPVVCVSFLDAVLYCNWLSQKEGLKQAYRINQNDIKWDYSANGYRLPTEAEWEYAAKGGYKNRGFRYSGSHQIDKVAVYSGNSNTKTHPVKSQRANELRIYDMSGNVYEWCWDFYKSDQYSSISEISNPKGPLSGEYRVIRGGSWGSDPNQCRTTNRAYSDPGKAYWDIGFRICRSVM